MSIVIGINIYINWKYWYFKNALKANTFAMEFL